MACQRTEEGKNHYKNNWVALPQLYQTKFLFRLHCQIGKQGVDKVYNRTEKRFKWPSLKKTCEKWISAYLSSQQAKDSRKLSFALRSIETTAVKEVVLIDHQKICMTATIYNQVLVMINHFTKYAEAVPSVTASAEETCDLLIKVWIARHECPSTFQTYNGKALVCEFTTELMKRSQVAQPTRPLINRKRMTWSKGRVGQCFTCWKLIARVTWTRRTSTCLTWWARTALRSFSRRESA